MQGGSKCLGASSQSRTWSATGRSNGSPGGQPSSAQTRQGPVGTLATCGRQRLSGRQPQAPARDACRRSRWSPPATPGQHPPRAEQRVNVVDAGQGEPGPGGSWQPRQRPGAGARVGSRTQCACAVPQDHVGKRQVGIVFAYAATRGGRRRWGPPAWGPRPVLRGVRLADHSRAVRCVLSAVP